MEAVRYGNATVMPQNKSSLTQEGNIGYKSTIVMIDGLAWLACLEYLQDLVIQCRVLCSNPAHDVDGSRVKETQVMTEVLIKIHC